MPTRPATTSSVLTVATQRSVTSSPITVESDDEVINLNVSTTSPTCTLPDASTRSGLVVIFKDAGGQFSSHNLIITPFAGQTIDGLSSVTLSTNYQVLQLRPYNDGVGTGWSIE